MAETEEKAHQTEASEKQENKKREKKAREAASEAKKESRFCFDLPVFVMLLALALVIGAFISAIYFAYAQKGTTEGTNTETCQIPNVADANKSCVNVLPPSEVGKKVKYFIDESFLKARGYSLEITDINSYDELFYEVIANVKTPEGEFPAGFILATKDGKKVVLSAYDTNSPLPPQPTPKPAEYKKSDKPDVLMFVMSFCPYGQQAEKALRPAVELLGEKINFEPHFVIYSKDYGYKYPDYCIDENANYCSMHGINELKEDIRQLCIWKYEREKFWPYVSAIYEQKCSLSNIETCWKEQASAAGIDIAKIEKCFNEEAISLLEKEVELNEKYNVRGSPTILINETEYEGARTPESYKTAICSAFNTAPSECSQKLSEQSGSASGQC